MFDTTWKLPDIYASERQLQGTATRLSPETVETVALLRWEEHCQECAAPACYRTCLKYRRRMDGKCSRMAYGFAENSGFSGLFDFGMDCRFEPWGQIQCWFNPLAYGPEKVRRMDAFNRRLSRGVLSASKKLRVISPNLKATWAVNGSRNRWFLRKGRGVVPEFDAFVIECHSTWEEPFKLHLQCDYPGESVIFRRSFDILPGGNYYEVPFGDFNIPPGTKPRILLYPENDLRCRLVFTWLDFVRFAPRPVEQAVPAEKVKCVAWDLDNTLWKGILIEDGPDGVRLNEEAVDIIRLLDRRGILNTVVSKNTHREALSVLEKMGIAEYFIYPAINWGAKSESLKQVASRINIGLDTFAFVDDSPHEREEVSARLPMVRTFSDRQAAALPDLPEFDVPATEMAAQRRLSYLAEMKREEIQASFGDDYETFLRGLEMRMEIFQPVEEGDRTRCIELLQRSNQLNISTHRYAPEEFAGLLSSKEMECYAFRCHDKFGDYGIAGFMSVALEAVPRIQDLVISCRIAQKHFEHAMICWLSGKLKHDGHGELLARLIKTKRNGPLVEVFKSLPFEIIQEDNEVIEYKLSGLDMADEGIIETVFIGQA